MLKGVSVDDSFLQTKWENAPGEVWNAEMGF